MTPRFKIRAIRPWSRTRRDAKAPSSGSIDSGPVSNGDGHRLGKILSAYDRRIASSALKQQSRAERQEQFRQDADRTRDTVIAPALGRIGEEIVEHGHSWDIESRVDILGQPAVACAFTPQTVGAAQEGNELTFRFHFPDRLSVSGAIPGLSELQALPARSYRIADVDCELIRAEVTRFVTYVLAES